MSAAFLAVVAALVALTWFGWRHASERATPIAPDDPIWQDALARARATVPVLRDLHAQGHDVWVKFRLDPRGAAPEHVWGRVLAIEADVLRCTLETPPIAPAAVGSEPVAVRLEQVEDWQVQLEDGTIRGGFTTRAQVRIAERDRYRVPRHVRDQVARMVD